MYKINFNYNAHIIASKITVLPNKHGGVRTLRLGSVDTLWTGHIHLFTARSVEMSITDVDSIYSLSSLDESDEKRLLLFERWDIVSGEYYKYWTDAAIEIEKKTKK